jgi:hypothetical protein
LVAVNDEHDCCGCSCPGACDDYDAGTDVTDAAHRD